jgi:hypothetical protein
MWTVVAVSFVLSGCLAFALGFREVSVFLVTLVLVFPVLSFLRLVLHYIVPPKVERMSPVDAISLPTDRRSD